MYRRSISISIRAISYVDRDPSKRQLANTTAEVLNVAYRRSDLIESIHDGSFFSDAVKLYVFLPTGILLIIMWGTGIYLFLLPRLRKRKKAS